MQSTSNLHSDLEARDIHLSIEQGRLKVTPANKLTPELRRAIREHKLELIRVLEQTRIKTIAAQLVKKYSPVHIELGSSFLINAKERHIIDAVNTHPCGLITHKSKVYLTSWGAPPASAYEGLRYTTREVLGMEAAE